MNTEINRLDKAISGMLNYAEIDVSNENQLKEYEINAIVNAANPTLMGSNQGVDGAIHDQVNKRLKDKKFKDKIKEQTHTEHYENMIRCRRGQAVVTEGYGLCQYIIHAVGIPNDGQKQDGRDCSSSRVRVLESCYYGIVEKIKQNLDIKSIAIPIIGSGEYGFPFELAARIAVVSVGNALLEWKRNDEELFNMAEIKKIYFCTYDKDPAAARHKNEVFRVLFSKYKKIFNREEKAVYQSSWDGHIRYIREVQRYDQARGYFSITKLVRLCLLYIRILFMPLMLMKDCLGGSDWDTRCKIVEMTAITKMLCAIAIGAQTVCFSCSNSVFFRILMGYFMGDTISYLLTLILMADIQRPSANVIRSIILLFINYIEVIFELSYFFFIQYKGTISFLSALRMIFMGNIAQTDRISYTFAFFSAVIKFFFISFAFGYLTDHMRRRRFIS